MKALPISPYALVVGGGLAVSGNLVMMAFNLVTAVRAFGRGESVLAGSLGFAVASLGVWAILVSHRWSEATQRRLAVEIELAERTRDAMARAVLQAVEVEGVNNAQRH